MSIYKDLYEYYSRLSDLPNDNRLKIKIEYIIKNLKYIENSKSQKIKSSYMNNLKLQSELYLSNIVTKDSLNDFWNEPYSNTYNFERTSNNILKKILPFTIIFFPESYSRVDNQTLYIIMDGINCLTIRLIYSMNKIRVIIDKLSTCSISGTQLLENLEYMIRNYIKEAETIDIVDESIIRWNSVNISLAYLFILVKGYSWYNSIGYIQSNFVEQQMEWNIIRNLSLFEHLNNITKTDWNKFITKSDYPISYNDTIQFKNNKIHPYYYDLISQKFDLDTSVTNICSIIYTHIKNKFILEKSIIELYIIILNFCFCKIDYFFILEKSLY
jgi:hypothetical protein